MLKYEWYTCSLAASTKCHFTTVL